jgi:hypothetical protein
MEIDDSIAQLAAKLDAWFESHSAVFTSDDPPAQADALVRGFAIAKEFDALKGQALAALAALAENADASASNERIAALTHGFEAGAKLSHALHDEFGDRDGEATALRSMDAIAKALNTAGAGRTALSALLDSPDAGVRASAGAYLIDLMPDQVIPVLREIDKRGGGSSAASTAHWAWLRWRQQSSVGAAKEEKAGAVGAGDAASFREFADRYRHGIVVRLKRICELGDAGEAQDRFLIVSLAERPQDYVQCVFDTWTRILCEAASGFFYTEPRSYWLPEESVAALARLGFSTDDSASNFRMWLDLPVPPDLNAIADLLLRALHDAYGARERTLLVLHTCWRSQR